MPLHKIIQHDTETKILVWKITETLQGLSDGIALSEKSIMRIATMKSELHRRAFLSVRKLLQLCGYEDSDLYYDAFGKPHLHDGRHISISHSHECSCIIISDKTTGLDLEMRRDKIALIADKFIEPTFILDKNALDYINKLTVNWGIKEAVFKIRNEKGISFKDHIQSDLFEMADGKTKAVLHFNELQKHFDVFFCEIDSYTLVYLFETD